MPLNLIYGPPNTGRAGLVRQRFTDALDRDPVLVVPTLDDVYRFERELCETGATLGGAVMTFGGLFRAVATAGGSPPAPELTAAQRLRAISVAVAERRTSLKPLRSSSDRSGFAPALELLFDELGKAGLEPMDVEAKKEALAGSGYLADLVSLYAGYAVVRERVGRVDSHRVAREAIALLQEFGEFWQRRPVFLYGLDDLTGNQFELIEALTALTDVTVALLYEEGNAALQARASLLGDLRKLEVATETRTEPDPANTEDPLLYHLERNFGAPAAERNPAGEALVMLRSAGERGEAEAIAAEVAGLLAGGVAPDEIAIVLRDPALRGPLIATVLESYGVATALEAEIPAGRTAVGEALTGMFEAEFGNGRAADLLRFMRGPSALSPSKVDWFEGDVRRRRVQSAEAALELWTERYMKAPGDLIRIREAATGPPGELAMEVGRLAAAMAARPLLGDEDGPMPEPGLGLELRAAAAISEALADLADTPALALGPSEIAAAIQNVRFRAWSGPVAGRVRIADPYRLRAARFEHVFVGSLQDGEFPRRERGGDPFLSDMQRDSLGLEARRDVDAEERYLFHSCLALPRKRLFLSYRDSDENGVALPRSPLLDDVERLLSGPNTEGGAEPTPTRGRDLASIVYGVAEAPSENELARAIAAHGAGADTAALLAAAGTPAPIAERVGHRVRTAEAIDAVTRAPGPVTDSPVLEALGGIDAFGGTTLEQFDSCSYLWFVSHELDPLPLGPDPEPLVQGGLMHGVLERLYRERPGGDAAPRQSSLETWIERGGEITEELARKRKLGNQPPERAMVRRVEGLLTRFLTEESRRGSDFEPWVLEATFGMASYNDRPGLQAGSWHLHGAIDRIDRAPDGRTLVFDYKVAREVTARARLEEQAKLQLQLYLMAVAEHWEGQPVGGLYYPLRGTSLRRPRGAVLEEAADDLAPYHLYDNDLVDEEGLEELLADARRRADAIVERIRRGDIRRDPGPRAGLRGHDTCPSFCEFASICRRDRAPAEPDGDEGDGL